MPYKKHTTDTEKKKERVALITVMAVLLVLFFFSSCGTVEYMYSEAQWTAHLIHYHENMDMPNCQFCIEYNSLIP
tara:strand:- start:1743 stop:1967 length:225 start_codon:yes stop_codon:yes gene_type:complete